MTKKHFIELADTIKRANKRYDGDTTQTVFTDAAIHAIADYCKSVNPRFNRERWLDYIKGTL